MRKLTNEFVKNYFQERGCELLEKIYYNVDTKMKYRCVCGNISFSNFDNFKNKGARCQNCRSEKNRLKFEEVKKLFDDANYILLSTEYIKNNIQLDCVCSNGHKIKARVAQFKRGHRCRKCTYEKTKFKEYKKYFEKMGCEVLTLEDNYKQAKDRIKYICDCGKISESTYHNFKYGRRCRECGIQKGIKTNIANGYCLERKYKNDFDLYKSKVIKETEKIYRKNKLIINPKNLKRGHNNYHLDHKFSIFDGFRNNISISIMSSIHNLEMLKGTDNVKKNRKSSITKEQLCESYYG